jgi:hypothetical protein
MEGEVSGGKPESFPSGYVRRREDPWGVGGRGTRPPIPKEETTQIKNMKYSKSDLSFYD